MGKKRGTSNAPLILGVIGAILMVPGWMCAYCFADFISDSAGLAKLLIWATLPIITGIIGGIKGKSTPTLSMVLLLFSAASAFIGWFYSLYTSIFHLAALILFIIGAIMAKVQKME